MRWLACVVVVVAVARCGGSSPQTHTGGGSSRAVWAAKTQQLCREKRVALARLGGVHITYASIARVGLPAVKRSLDGYLGRLLGVLQTYSTRQQQLANPPSVAPVMNMALDVDRQAQAATGRLRGQVVSG